ncbi:hypothetical protein Taro_053366 [Colocasia esculenta]|uniref:Uncharacterized protein n=1 Tax=Colocasia esculenta TaxID=4460 RepID=A0A843XKS5_COLES|nr:hypothetical protein [Colocasia esculenta]
MLREGVLDDAHVGLLLRCLGRLLLVLPGMPLKCDSVPGGMHNTGRYQHWKAIVTFPLARGASRLLGLIGAWRRDLVVLGRCRSRLLLLVLGRGRLPVLGLLRLAIMRLLGLVIILVGRRLLVAGLLGLLILWRLLGLLGWCLEHWRVARFGGQLLGLLGPGIGVVVGAVGETSQQWQGGGDGAIVVVLVASSGSPSQLYITLGPFRVSRSMGGDRENWVLGLGRGSGSRGRYSWCRQAKELIEKHDELDIPVPGQVQEEVSAEESVAQPHRAAFFRTLYQGAWQPGQTAAGGQPPVPPPAVPEQQADPEVEQPAVQQESGTGSTRAGRRRMAVTEDRTALLERFLHLRLSMFFGEYDPDKAESWTHELEHTFETTECAEEDQMTTRGGGRGKQQKHQSRFAEQSVQQGAEQGRQEAVSGLRVRGYETESGSWVVVLPVEVCPGVGTVLEAHHVDSELADILQMLDVELDEDSELGALGSEESQARGCARGLSRYSGGGTVVFVFQWWYLVVVGRVLNATAVGVTFLLPLLGSTSACAPRVAHGVEFADVRNGKATPKSIATSALLSLVVRRLFRNASSVGCPRFRGELGTWVCSGLVPLDLTSVTARLIGSYCVVLSGLDTGVMNQ